MTQYLNQLNSMIASCVRCTRLRSYCQQIARTKRRAFRDETYWGRPVPGFGDPKAELWVVGLAPGAHGANRTGRVFTGDQSGRWLYRALHRYGFSNQPSWEKASDGLKLHRVWVSCIVRCAPPGNRPSLDEIKACSDFLKKELMALNQLKVIVALGQLAYREITLMLQEGATIRPPRFRHGAEWTSATGIRVLASYHPSQQNTFTGKLTEPMFDSVFQKARGYLKATPEGQ